MRGDGDGGGRLWGVSGGGAAAVLGAFGGLVFLAAVGEAGVSGVGEGVARVGVGAGGAGAVDCAGAACGWGGAVAGIMGAGSCVACVGSGGVAVVAVAGCERAFDVGVVGVYAGGPGCVVRTTGWVANGIGRVRVRGWWARGLKSWLGWWVVGVWMGAVRGSGSWECVDWRGVVGRSSVFQPLMGQQGVDKNQSVHRCSLTHQDARARDSDPTSPDSVHKSLLLEIAPKDCRLTVESHRDQSSRCLLGSVRNWLDSDRRVYSLEVHYMQVYA